MNSSSSKTATGSIGPMGASATARTPPTGAALLLDAATFGPTNPAALTRPAAPQAPAEPVPVLRLAVQGLSPVERQLLEGLVKVSQRRTPRLEILQDGAARQADVVVIDTRDPAAMAWARQRPWLSRFAVIWIDGAEAAPGHTLLPRPVQWPILPMVLARALESGPASTATVASCRERHSPQVLVVDDNLAVRAHLRSLLEPWGYGVTDADSVAAALRTISQRHFDCVLMDVVMPNADGYEGCRQIKALLHGADAVPVVMLTSKASPFDRLSGKMAGCDAYLTKPVDSVHLGEVLAQQVRSAPASPVVPVTRHS